jgi:hypothetical protein
VWALAGMKLQKLYQVSNQVNSCKHTFYEVMKLANLSQI